MNTKPLAEKNCSEEYEMFDAEILNKENQNLFTGKGHFESDASYGAFWPNIKSGVTTNTAAILKHSNGRRFVLKDLHLCPGVMGDHFHFQIALKDEGFPLHLER